ncbi:MAG: hypothetical protein PHG96_00790 [Kiritimatiellae bacterium]|nr:hypothetical protein [Kiritimatiellia bacterium]MDD3543876.1 hypothetical protein [Kiritimatiellia bacterium]MDD4025363.1 hypothetical protein [Kiritimatiellia bacterium]MDD4621817.1 hypothetical protein [Kiritimatiellia bacterium]
MFSDPYVPARKLGRAQPGAPDLHVIITGDVDPAVVAFCAGRRRDARQQRFLRTRDLVKRVEQGVGERLQVLPVRVKINENLAAASK